MKKNRDPGCRPALGFAGLTALWLLAAGALAAAEAPVFETAGVDVPPALLASNPLSWPAHQPLFGTRLRFEFVVDALGQTGDVTLLEVKATLSETGKILEESDLPALKRLGLLGGLPGDASFAEISDLLTKPFIEPAKAAVLSRHYRAGRKNGAAVATRVTDVVEFRTEDLPSALRLRPSLPANPPQAATPVPPYRPPATQEPMPAVEPYRPPVSPEPMRSIIAVVPLAERSGTFMTPGQPPTTVVPTADGRIIYAPGQPQVTVVATPGGGSTIYTPGQVPTTVVPVSSTESIVFTPGQPQSTIMKTPDGGSTIYTPGQPPTTIVPTGGGGSIIYAPGQPPVIVPPNP